MVERTYVNGGLSIFELVSSHGTRIWTLCPSAESFFASEYPSTACPPLGVFTMSTFFEPDAVDARTRTLVRLDVTCLHRRRLDNRVEDNDARWFTAMNPPPFSLSCSLSHNSLLLDFEQLSLLMDFDAHAAGGREGGQAMKREGGGLEKKNQQNPATERERKRVSVCEF